MVGGLTFADSPNPCKQTARKGDSAMRIIRRANISVVVHIRDHNNVTVVVPADLGPDEALSMARLVLTPDEHHELTEAIESPRRTAPEACGPHAGPCDPTGSPPPPAFP